MKRNPIGSALLGLLMLSTLLLSTTQSIIRTRSTPDIKLKVFHPMPERSLKQTLVSKELSNQDYSFDEDVLEITKKQFMNSLNLKPHMNLYKPLRNLEAQPRMLPDTPIAEDFIENMTSGLQMACKTCKKETKGDVTVVTKDGKPLVDITLKVRPQDMTIKEDHNVVITMDNYQHTGEFDKKKMEGLAIIESQKGHRKEIETFIYQRLVNFLELTEENDTKSAGGLKTVGDGLTELLTALDPQILKVGGDENSGYIFEKRSPNGIILVLVMAYTVGKEMFEIKMKTRAMDEFEMQIREFLREEDKIALNTQLGELLKSDALKETIQMEEISESLNKLVSGTYGSADLTAACAKGIVYNTEFMDTVPNTIVLAADLPEEDEPNEDGGPKIPKVCIYESSFVSMLEILEMPYIFFSFRNSRLLVEHFIPAIVKADTLKALTTAFEGIVNLNKSIEDAVKENMDADGNAIENIKEFQIDDLIAEINKSSKKMGLKLTDEGAKKFWKEGEITRIFMKEVNGAHKLSFNFPHKLYKDKDSVKPITNEFIFQDDIAYDAVRIFTDTLHEFEAAMAAAKN